jgi:ketosteroid isomerase-like protein
MTGDNFAITRRFVDAFNRSDFDSVADLTDPNVELHEWPTAPGARTYHGPEGVRAALDSWFEAWEWMQIEIVELVDAGDSVLVILDQRARGKGSEVEVGIRSFNVYSFRDGKVTRIQLFTDRKPALEAAGLKSDYQEERQ